MRTTWAAPDIQFDKDGRRIRPRPVPRPSTTGWAPVVEPCRAPFSWSGVCVKPTCGSECLWAEKP